MTNNNMIDLTMGVQKQAWAVLHMLDREPDFADYNRGYYRVSLETRPWYNGRECGFVVSMKPGPLGASAPVLHIAFFEHRNTDSICCLRWETTNFYWDHPLEDPKIFEKAYPSDKSFDVAASFSYGQVGKAADWIYREFAKFYEEYKPDVQKHGRELKSHGKA